MNKNLKSYLLKSTAVISSGSLIAVASAFVLPNMSFAKDLNVKDRIVQEVNDVEMVEEDNTPKDKVVLKKLASVPSSEVVNDNKKIDYQETIVKPKSSKNEETSLQVEKEENPKVPETSEELNVEKPQEEEEITPPVKEEEKTPEVSKTPEVDEPQEKEEEIVPPVEEEKQDTPQVNEVQKNEETQNYAELIEEAARRTQNVDSAYYRFSQTGYSVISVKYNKSQNREYTVTDEGEEYLEGMPGRYTQDWDLSGYSKQDWWRKESGSNEWISKGRIHSGFGMAPLSFLNDVKSATLVSTRPFNHYKVVIDKEMANKAADVQFSNPNMFKTDVTLEVSINHEGYIVLLNLDCKKDVLNEGVSEVSLWLHAGDFNKTVVQRPKELANVTITDTPKKDELTPTKKVEIKEKIAAAYKKTRDVNSATYNLNGKIVMYNRNQNAALMQNGDVRTYYEGTAGKYIDHDYVTPEFQQDSWTKTGSDAEWQKNVRKHTTFTARELYFLDMIFDVTKVDVKDDVTTYTIVILKQYANLAYSHAYGVNEKFDDNITMTVSLNKEGYVCGLHGDFGDNKLDLEYSNLNTTTIQRPEDIA